MNIILISSMLLGILANAYFLVKTKANFASLFAVIFCSIMIGVLVSE